jgi:hypothetical protein
VGTASITVSNPAGSGGVSAPFALLIGSTAGTSGSGAGFSVTTLNQASKDLVFDPVHQEIFLTVPNISASGNTISVLDLATAQIVGAQFAGSNPNVLAISDDSQFLYAGIDGFSSVQRFILPGLSPDVSYSLGTAGFFGPQFALDLGVAPGAPHTTAVTTGSFGVSPSAQGGITIYDDGTARTMNAKGGSSLYDSLQWGSDVTALFAANGESSGFDFYTLSVNASGVTLSHDSSNVFSSFGNRIHFDAGTKLIYSNDGHVVNPTSSASVGTFNTSGLMVPDSALNKAFFVTGIGSSTVTIKSFDLTLFTQIDSITVNNVTGNHRRLIRWGQNGLAFNTDSGQIFLIGGNFVH